MKTLIWSVAISLCLVSMVNIGLAQESVTFTAKCDGGSLPLEHQALVVRITSDEVVFIQRGKQFSVPVSHITFVAYSDRNAETYLAGIQWDEPSGEIVLMIQRQDYTKVVAVLRSTFEKVRAAKETAGIDRY
ncbi:MAG: hypothetical protein ACLQU1_05370 [Bryobacteraceae bacterium]